MTYQNLLEDSLNSIPEFNEEYKKNLKRDVIDAESGMHIVFSYIFAPMLIKAIRSDRALTRKMFDYLEKMAAAEDIRVQEVCDQSVIETLYAEYPVAKLWPLMHEKTREGYIAVSQYMN